MVISQSGFSTNSIAALDFIRGGGCGEGVQSVAITGNPSAPIRNHADVVVDYGVGVESVDFVTMGVQTLVEFLMLFALYASHAIGRISGERVDRELRCFESAFDAHAAALRACEEWMDEEKLTLSRRVPACVVGNGPNYGVAEEGALKLNECIKIAAMHSEGEEFVHGPQMQLTPDSLLFMLDDPRGSERLANLHAQFRTVTKGAFFITAHPRGIEGELAIPVPTNPLMCAIPNLVAFQYLAAQKTEELERWEMHPYVRALLRHHWNQGGWLRGFDPCAGGARQGPVRAIAPASKLRGDDAAQRYMGHMTRETSGLPASHSYILQGREERPWQ